MKKWSLGILLLCMSFLAGTGCSSDDVIFPPSVVTASPSEVAQTTALTGGALSSDGGSPVVSVGVCYDTSPNPGLSDSRTVDVVAENFVSELSGLTPGTTYYVRAYATNSGGLAFGNQVVFTTAQAILPEVVTGPASEFAPLSMRVSAHITAQGTGTVLQKGFYFGYNQVPVLKWVVRDDGDEYSAVIPGMVEGSTIWYQAFVTTEYGTATGEVRSGTLTITQE